MNKIKLSLVIIGFVLMMIGSILVGFSCQNVGISLLVIGAALFAWNSKDAINKLEEDK